MSSILVARNLRSALPNWTIGELEALSNSPGDNAVDGMIDSFSPKLLGSGANLNGWLFTETAGSIITAIGGSYAFSNKYTFPSSTLCRQANASICAPDWVICVSFDTATGMVCHYSTDGWVTVNQVTISAGVNNTYGEIWMPALWVDQRTPGRAIVTAFKGMNVSFGGSNDTPSGANTWRRRFDIDSGNGAMGWTLTYGALSANGVDLTQVVSDPNYAIQVEGTLDLPVGTTVTSVYFKVCSNPSPISNDHKVFASGSTYTVTPGANCSGYSTKSGLTATADGNFGWYAYDQRPTLSGVGSAYAFDFNLEGTGTNPFGAAAGAAAYVTEDFGATWTEITDASIVGYIQPGSFPSGAMDAPYTDATPYRFAYGYIDTGGTYPVPRLHRVVTSTVADISPVADGKTYGVPYDKPHHRAICIAVKDANTAILCGESRNASSGTSVYRVFLTRNLWDTTPTWTPLTDESATLDWHGVYIAGDTPNVAYFLGTNGNIGVWESDRGLVVLDKRGDSTKTSKAVFLCGL